MRLQYQAWCHWMADSGGRSGHSARMGTEVAGTLCVHDRWQPTALNLPFQCGPIVRAHAVPFCSAVLCIRLVSWLPVSLLRSVYRLARIVCCFPLSRLLAVLRLLPARLPACVAAASCSRRCQCCQCPRAPGLSYAAGRTRRKNLLTATCCLSLPCHVG